jgi:hypothetical protein
VATIRDEQIRALAEAIEGDWVDRLAAHLRAHHAEAVAELTDEALRRRVWEGARRARRYGLGDESSLGAFVALQCVIAPGFDRHPAILRVLRDASLPPGRQIDALAERIRAAEWLEARAWP